MKYLGFGFRRSTVSDYSNMLEAGGGIQSLCSVLTVHVIQGPSLTIFRYIVNRICDEMHQI